MFRSVSSSGVLSGQGVVQTLTTTGLIQVEAGQVLSVLLQVCGYQEAIGTKDVPIGKRGWPWSVTWE